MSRNRIITVLRKPVEGTVARNVLAYGTGGLNIDASRVPFQNESDKENAKPRSMLKSYQGFEGEAFVTRDRTGEDPSDYQHSQGRWPTNVILTELASELLDEDVGVRKSGSRNGVRKDHSGFGTFEEKARDTGGFWPSSEGGPSRYFKVIL